MPEGHQVEALAPLFRYDLPIEEDPIRREIDRRVPWAIHDESFSHQSFGTGPWPDQGWKLHVSATPHSAVEVLEATLGVLLAEGVRFKVAASVNRLASLNSGLFGVAQIGKFITVYPSDDAQAVHLAVKLDEVTRGFRGPRVPTDRPLRPGSLVHYRYGAMISRSEAQAAGNEAGGAYDILDPVGRLTDDLRLPYYVPPAAEIPDPFVAAGVFVPRPPRPALLNGRYLVVNVLSPTPRGGVFRAIDIAAQPSRWCLVKEAWHDVGLDPYGRDARDWTENEARILSRYAGDPFLPRFYDSFEVHGNRYIAIEYIEGTSLNKVLAERHSRATGIDPAALVSIGLATAEALAHLHDLGLVFRDFKPANLIATPDGGYRLIDFGIVHQYLEDSRPPLSVGTPPYYPREPFDGDQPSPIDDVFAWGAVLYHLAGGDASYADMPKGDDYQRPFPRRPITEIRPALPARLAAVIDRAVAWDRADRYATMREAQDALRDAARRIDGSRETTPSGVGIREAASKTECATPVDVSPADAMRLAREVGDALCAAAEERDGGLCWKSRSEWSEQSGYNPDLYAGASGIGLFLAELARATGEARYADAARGAARWLSGPIWGRGRAQHGLHCGEPGVTHFLLRLADLLNAPGYVTAAELRMRRLRGAQPITLDLIYGTAGTILPLLSLYRVTGESAFLADACAAGDELVRSALAAPEGSAGCYWDVPSGACGGPVISYLGLLHGAAGIGLALGRLAIVTSEERYMHTARRAAELLLAQARPSSADVATEGPALTWPRHLGDNTMGLQAHCHGAGGIGQFFLWLDRVVPDPRYLEAARGAGRTAAAQRDTEQRSGICHGLSGIGHIMIDSYQALDDEQWLAVARECAGQLQRFCVADRTGVYAMDGAGAVSPDLMLGYAGVGSLFLRLADPENAQDLIFGDPAHPRDI